MKKIFRISLWRNAQFRRLGDKVAAPPAAGIEYTTRCLPASTLVEVIVASVIFLTVFAISLHTLTRLRVDPREGERFTEADCALRSAFREYGDGLHAEGEYVRTWEHCQITVTIAPYRGYDALQEITLTTAVNRKRIEYKHIVERKDE